MCQFFSFVTYKGKKYYFDSEARRQRGEHDSHSNICSTFLNSLIKEDKSNKYEFTSEGLIKDSIRDDEEQFDDVKDWMANFSKTREFWKICVRSLSKGINCLDMIPEDKRQATSDIIHEFACWSAEQVLDIYEKKYPEDDRPRQAIEAKRKWLKGEITDKKLKAAADAAWAAAWAASAAAWAARDAAGDAAWTAEIVWQKNRLQEMIMKELEQ